MKPQFYTQSPLLMILLLLITGCSDDRKEETTKQSKPTVYTVNYPLAFFAEKIAGDQANVVFPTIDGDPAFWTPDAEQVMGFQNADLILLNGANYAEWTASTFLPEARQLDTSAAFRDQFIAIEGKKTHSHGPSGQHSHAGTAFTTWLDLTLAVQHASAINNKLKLSNSGFADLKSELLALDNAWEAEFSRFSGQPLLGSHPVYQYLKRRYNLNLKSVHWEPDVAPGLGMWDELKTLLLEHPAKVMLWEGEPLPETKARLSEMGIQTVVFDPCGNRPESGDFLSVMKQNLINIQSIKK